MKKLFLYLLMPLLAMSSCNQKNEEEAKPVNDGKKYKVTLSVASQEKKDFGVMADDEVIPLKDLVNQLSVIAFDQNGNEIGRMTRTSNDPQFGTFVMDLPAGELTVVAVGSKTPFEFNEFYKKSGATSVMLPFSSANFQYLQGDALPGQRAYKTDDTFFSRRKINVTKPSDIPMVLTRIIGKLLVTVEDFDDYYVTVKNDAAGFMLEDERSAFGIQIDHSTRIYNGKKSFCGYILRTDRPLELEIRAGGKTRELTVPIYKNQVTVVTGRFVPKIPDFRLYIDNRWSTDTTRVQF